MEQLLTCDRVHPAEVGAALRVFQTCEARRKDYKDRYAFDFAVIVKLFNKGCSFETTCAAFAAATNHPTEYQVVLRKKGLEKANACLRRIWRKASRQTSLLRDKQEVSKLADQLRSLVHGRVWKGRSGKSDKAVLLAHIEHCVISNQVNQEGVFVWQASVRGLSEKAELGISTASLANDRLTKQGWIRLTSPTRKRATHASEYQLGERWTESNTYTSEEGIYVRVNPRPCTHGVFENKYGWGATCRDIWWAIVDGSRTTKEIQLKTGCHPKTIKKHVHKMEEHSLIYVIDEQIIPNLDYDFFKLAKDLETEDRALIRINRHDRERIEYRRGQERNRALEKAIADLELTARQEESTALKESMCHAEITSE